LQEKVSVITALKETLCKQTNEVVPLYSIDPKVLKIDVTPLAPKLRNNRTVHTDYIRHTQKETATLREIVKSERLFNPLNTSLDYACKYTKRIQELLVILNQTCPCITDLGTKLVAVTHKNNNKQASKTKSWLWHRLLSHLNFGAINHLARQGLVRGLPKLKFEKDHLCSACAMGKRAVATACFTQNRSIIRLRHRKTPYEILHNKLPDLSFFHVSGALCYPINDSENLGKLQPKGPALNEMTPGIISSGLMQKSSSSTPYVPPSRNDWDLMFQPMFDELLYPLTSVDHQAPEVITPIADVIPPVQADSTGSTSSTMVDKDASSLRKSHTTTKIQSLVVPQDVEEDNLDMEVAHIGNDPLFGVPIPVYAIFINVSTRLQLHEQALFCYSNAFLTSVEPKTYKEALTQSCWIEAMQEELNEFERIEVWELVPRPDKVMVITLKRIYKISQSPRGIFINKSKYALKSIKKYSFESCDLVDISIVEKSKLDDDKEGKAVDPSHYRDFADADHASCQDTLRSTSGGVQFLGERLISWSSKRQKSVAISNIEAAYIALSGCCAQILWMRSQISDYGLGFNKIPIYHFIKEQVENGVIELYFVNTEYQLADLFTKALGIDKIEFLINKLGMRSFTPETLKQLMDEVDE
nr:retrovirus-related Pol polyprotein from transposon TNT 1-94 [Tanacetum cinerariifolium]